MTLTHNPKLDPKLKPNLDPNLKPHLTQVYALESCELPGSVLTRQGQAPLQVSK